ncbi:MAG: hypothetical protein Q9166_000096 [cf. Caloplaca sp. 2 TL-2023]
MNSTRPPSGSAGSSDDGDGAKVELEDASRVSSQCLDTIPPPPAPSSPTQRLLLKMGKQRGQKRLYAPGRAKVLWELGNRGSENRDLACQKDCTEDAVRGVRKRIDDANKAKMGTFSIQGLDMIPPSGTSQVRQSAKRRLTGHTAKESSKRRRL